MAMHAVAEKDSKMAQCAACNLSKTSSCLACRNSTVCLAQCQDQLLLLRTVPAVFSGEGAAAALPEWDALQPGLQDALVRAWADIRKQQESDADVPEQQLLLQPAVSVGHTASGRGPQMWAGPLEQQHVLQLQQAAAGACQLLNPCVG